MSFQIHREFLIVAAVDKADLGLEAQRLLRLQRTLVSDPVWVEAEDHGEEVVVRDVEVVEEVEEESSIIRDDSSLL